MFARRDTYFVEMFLLGVFYVVCYEVVRKKILHVE